MQIDNDPKLINWLNQVCLSKTNNTRELYTTVINKYCSLISLSPSQLIDQCEKESTLVYSKQSLPIHIGTFKNYLRENMSRTSRVTYLAAVSSFYAAHEISVPKKLMKREIAPEISIENDLSITDKDITAAIGVSDPLMKLIIGIQYTSGLSMSDVRELKVKNIVSSLTDDGITCLSMQRAKTGVKFHTFLCPIVTDWAIKQISSLKLEDNDYLICIEKGEQINENVFTGMYRATSEILGMNKPEFRGYNKMHSHNMRKMFYNTILNIGGWGMGELAEYFMGHRIPATRAAYFKATPEKLKEEYRKFVMHFESVLNVDKNKEEKLL